MINIPFTQIDWSEIENIEYKGESGSAFWRTIEKGGLRIRQVEYSPGYKADHWCQKGHVVQCLKGEFVSEMENGESYTLTEGMTYVVTDGQSSHRSVSEHGALLLIIDGEFLKQVQ